MHEQVKNPSLELKGDFSVTTFILLFAISINNDFHILLCGLFLTILQSTQVCVHVRTFAMQTQSESLHDLGHLHARSSSSASGAGFPSIQSTVRLDSSSAELPISHPNPTGSRIDGLHCTCASKYTLDSLPPLCAFAGSLCKVVTGRT